MLLVWVVNKLFWQHCNGHFLILRNISTLNRFLVPLAWSSFSGDKISFFTMRTMWHSTIKTHWTSSKTLNIAVLPCQWWHLHKNELFLMLNTNTIQQTNIALWQLCRLYDSLRQIVKVHFTKSSYKLVIIYPSIFVLLLLPIRTLTSVVQLIPPVVLGCLSILSVFEDPYVYQRMLVLDLGKTLSKICFYKFIGIIKIYLQTFQVARS